MGISSKKILQLAEGGRLSAMAVSAHFGIGVEDAMKALRIMWDRGQLCPLDQAYWGLIPEDGTIPRFVGANTRRSDWYDADIAVLTDLFADGKARKATEVGDVLGDLTKTKARTKNVLEEMIRRGTLMKRQASSGGLYGKHPYIYGPTADSIMDKNDDIVNETAVKRSQARKKAKAVRPGKDISRDATTGDALLDSLTDEGKEFVRRQRQKINEG